MKNRQGIDAQRVALHQRPQHQQPQHRSAMEHMQRSWSGRLLALICFVAAFIVPSTLFAQNEPTVGVPFDVFERLTNQSDTHALGPAIVEVTVLAEGSEIRATVRARVSVQAFESGTTSVVVLPTGAVLTRATAGGAEIRLRSSDMGYVYTSTASGVRELELTYVVTGSTYDEGYSLPLPLPPSPSATVSATLPGTGLGAAMIPASSTSTTETGGNTRISGTVPAGQGVQVSWREGAGNAFDVSRASYTGNLLADESAIVWNATFDVELSVSTRTFVPLLSNSLAIHEILVDSSPATIVEEGGQIGVRVQGRGAHTVSTVFEVPVTRAGGPPGVRFDVPRVPVSRFELRLPGDKEVTVSPSGSVARATTETGTVATLHVPMTPTVAFNWPEAVPEGEDAEEIEVRASANLFHLAHAEEGVLSIRAIADFEITRGETSQLVLDIPASAQVNTVTSPSGGVADWRVNEEEQTLTVFLDRRVSGAFRLDIRYEQLFGIGADAPAEISVPLLRARDVSRQRGMVALLASREVALNPVREERVSSVGENQLPSDIRNMVTMTVAHTFRYLEENPSLTVVPTVPERQQGRFDANVDTLISLGDVTTTGTALAAIDVKSGSMMALRLLLPAGVNFLNLSAPSLRGHEVINENGRQVIEVEFTQEMEGQFRIEVTYERITTDADLPVGVPLLHVEGADVEQGRIAVEALSAVEVQPGSIEALSTIDVQALPQQLVLRTTNPILLAYRYVQMTPPPGLSLEVTRHQELDIQSASVENATYSTLVTNDGLAVTHVRYLVMNSREQFLRVRLPADSEVWSVMVNGIAETPALDESGESAEMLINIIHSEVAFPVEVTYATPVANFGMIGQLRADLAQPDMVIARAVWNVFLPDGPRYGSPRSSMRLVEGPRSFRDDDAYMVPPALSRATGGASVGTILQFEQQFARPDDRALSASIAYTGPGATSVGAILAVVGVVLAWLGLMMLLGTRRVPGVVAVVVGGLLFAGAIGPLTASPRTAVMVGGVLLAISAIVLIKRRVDRAFGGDDSGEPIVLAASPNEGEETRVDPVE